MGLGWIEVLMRYAETLRATHCHSFSRSSFVALSFPLASPSSLGEGSADFWGRRMPLGKMWHRRSSFSRRLKAFALCLVWRRCCVPNCCDRCRLMTWEGSKRNGFQNYCKLFWVWFQIWFLCQYKFWYDFGMGFVEFPFFWPVLVSGCLQIELPACFDGNKQENYKKLLCLFWSNSCQKPINIHIWSCIDITSKRNPISRSVTIYLSHFSAILIS